MNRENYFDRRVAPADVIDIIGGGWPWESTCLVCADGDLFIVEDAEGSDDGFLLYYGEMVALGDNREVLERWHGLVADE